MAYDLQVAEIGQAFLEYRATFDEPIFAYWFERRHGEIVSALHRALTKWHVGLENITWNQNPKNAAEIQLSFGVPALLSAIHVSVGEVTMNALNPDWSRAPELISMFQTGLDALIGTTKHTLQSQQGTLGFHVQPGLKSSKEIVGRLVDPKALDAADAIMYGVSVYMKDYVFVVDNSAVIPGGIFIKLVRTFNAQARFSDIAATLYNDEETVLRSLGLRLQ